MVEIKRGDIFRFTLTPRDPNGGLVNLTGKTLAVVIARRDTIESYEAPLLRLATPIRLTGTVLSNPDRYEVVGEFLATETRTLPIGTVYFLFRNDTDNQTLGEAAMRIV